MIIFIENLCGLQIAAYSPQLRRYRSLKIMRKAIATYRPVTLRGPTLSLPPQALRWLKFILGVMQFPIIQQDPYALAFRFNIWKRLLSDGMLTEFLTERYAAKSNEFYSVMSVDPVQCRVVDDCAIIGSNWLEYGSMSPQSYRRHLELLNREYPTAKHYCHPREQNRIPEEVFGSSRTIRLTEPVECHMWRDGIPSRLVTVCSSAVLSVVLGVTDGVDVDLVEPAEAHFDGPTGDAIKYTKRVETGARRISVGDLSRLLRERLARRGVAVRVVKAPL